ncbi:MAG: DedA family protein [Egibacteraceae bacterium]
MEQLADAVFSLSGLAAYVVIGLVAFGEAAAFVGLFLPGELALIAGGVLAAQGRVSLGVMAAVGCAAAIAGDAAGYEIGRRYGPRLLSSRLAVRGTRSLAIAEAQRALRRHGPLAVFVGRWTTVLRATVPALAGMAGMRYRTFALWNALGGVTWGAGCVLLGNAAGASFHVAHQVVGNASWVALGLLVAAFVAHRVWKRLRGGRTELPSEPSEQKATVGCARGPDSAG